MCRYTYNSILPCRIHLALLGLIMPCVQFLVGNIPQQTGRQPAVALWGTKWWIVVSQDFYFTYWRLPPPLTDEASKLGVGLTAAAPTSTTQQLGTMGAAGTGHWTAFLQLFEPFDVVAGGRILKALSCWSEDISAVNFLEGIPLLMISASTQLNFSLYIS